MWFRAVLVCFLMIFGDIRAGYTCFSVVRGHFGNISMKNRLILGAIHFFLVF